MVLSDDVELEMAMTGQIVSSQVYSIVYVSYMIILLHYRMRAACISWPCVIAHCDHSLSSGFIRMSWSLLIVTGYHQKLPLYIMIILCHPMSLSSIAS